MASPNRKLELDSCARRGSHEVDPLTETQTMIHPVYQCTCVTFSTAFQPSEVSLTGSVRMHIVRLEGKNETGEIPISASKIVRNTLPFNRLRSKTEVDSFNSTHMPNTKEVSTTFRVINNLPGGCGYPAGTRSLSVAARLQSRYACSKRRIPSGAAHAGSDS